MTKALAKINIKAEHIKIKSNFKILPKQYKYLNDTKIKLI